LALVAVVRALAIVPEDMEEAFSDVIEAPEPLKVVAVIVAPVKLPEASLATIVEAPLELEAVVLALFKVPEDMEEAFSDVMFAPEKVAEFDPVPPAVTGKVAELGTSTVVPLTITALPAG
jgi:hypothetical protein